MALVERMDVVLVPDAEASRSRSMGCLRLMSLLRRYNKFSYLQYSLER